MLIANPSAAQTTCLSYPAGSVPPSGYGASWDVFSSARELLVRTNCPASGTAVTLTIGKGDSAQLVYATAYSYAGSWQQHTLSGTPHSGQWLSGSGTKSITAPSGASVSAPLYVVGYVCTNRSGAWKCGCADSTCASGKWQLQGYTGPAPAGDDDDDNAASLVRPANPSCRALQAPSGACIDSPTHVFLRGQQCIANPTSRVTNATPCSARYTEHWKMELLASDAGKAASDVFRSRYQGVMVHNSISDKHSITVDYGPGGVLALQRNVVPGIVPTATYSFNNFSSGADAMCISMSVYIPESFTGSQTGSGKLGYGIWGGGSSMIGGGTSPVVQQGFVVRNVANWGPNANTRLYSYHLNRGANDMWQVQNQPKCDTNGCCIYGDMSAAGTIARGKWVNIEQELVLNDLDQANGYARLWIDGRQVGEITNMLIRESSKRFDIKGLYINDMWGGDETRPEQQARATENYWLSGYTVYRK